MAEQRIRRVVIAGGGTAGWLAAAALSRQLGQMLDLTLVESEEIGTVGVGEATIPTIRAFHAILGLDEREFMRETLATFKLGISFENWAREGDRYIHSFGEVGRSTWMGDFQHFWLEARAQGIADPIGDYCLEHAAAEKGCFAIPSEGEISYAFHLDAGRYARYLRRRAEVDGLRRVEGRIVDVERDGQTGDIAALRLDNGARVEGDLFLDCTGFRSLLIAQTLGVGYEDWTHWLPADRALAVQTATTAPAPPYTRAIAHDAGWRWRIPLQHRDGNGLVYSSRHLSDDAARERLLAAVEGETLIEPRLIRFQTGRRDRVWERNCIALSFASGFVEPLESTTIHLTMIGLSRLMQVFPFAGIQPSIVQRYNEQARNELERVRDFIVLHYHLNERPDPFWRACRETPPPESLQERIALFREAALAYQAGDDLFRVSSWLQVMLGQRLEPQAYHHMARIMGPERLAQALGNMRRAIADTVETMPAHQDFLNQYVQGAAA